MLVYLHDTPVDAISGVGANRSNVDEISKIDAFLKANDSVTLTADDGYKSILNLIPLLETHDVKLILFVTIGLVDRTVYPYEVQICDFLKHAESVVYEGKQIGVSDLPQKEEFFRSVHQSVKPKGLRERERFVESFFRENGVDDSSYKKDVFLNSQDVVSLSRHPNVEIGSHCVSHLVLPKLPSGETFRELRRSKQVLEELTGKEITKVSYPYGANDWKTRLLARAAGYKSGFGTENASGGRMAYKRVGLPSQ